MKHLVDIIIPTFNNPGMLQSCLNSITLSLYGPMRALAKVSVVNNGHPQSLAGLQENETLQVIAAGENLGWEGALKLAVDRTSAPFVMFLNDDVRFITGQKDWLWKLMATFNIHDVGAVGPASNFVMGPQNIFMDIVDKNIEVKYLIGFCLLIRREALIKAGGVDDSLPGGDDIDFSIRLRRAGYRLICRRDVFAFHHGAQTGQRLHPGFWNSQEMTERTHLALIAKHGMLEFWRTVIRGWLDYVPLHAEFADKDIEGEVCASHVIGDKVLELGCGGRKTVENAVGVDLHSGGHAIPFVTSGKELCVADVVGDVSVALPVGSGTQDTIIARHILEHCQDTVGTLGVWNRALKLGGRLIIACPNQALGNTIMMNPEHVVSFVPKSLENLARLCGFSLVSCHPNVNGTSFVMAFDKVAEAPSILDAPEPAIAPRAARLEDAACA